MFRYIGTRPAFESILSARDSAADRQSRTGLFVVVDRVFEIVVSIVELLHLRRALVLPLAFRDALLVAAQRVRHFGNSGLEALGRALTIAGAGRRGRYHR